jgi:hypothetical protein
MSEVSLDKLTQAQWFALGEEYYNGATLQECATKWEVTEDDIKTGLPDITGIGIRPPVKEEIDYSKPEYKKSTLARQSEGCASGRAPHDPPEEPVKHPKRIIEV